MAATDSAAVKVRPSISFMDVLPVICPDHAVFGGAVK